MLRPPLEIFVAHRDKSASFKRIKKAITAAQLSGYRINPLYINDETLKQKNNVPRFVFDTLNKSGAAIVLLTPDHRMAKESQKSLPSQSVTFEYGFLSAVFGDKRDDLIRVLGPKQVLPPRYRPDIKPIQVPTDAAAKEWVENFLHTLGVPRESDVIFDLNYKMGINDGDLGSHRFTENSLALFFGEELASLRKASEKLLYIFERAFTDVYFEDKSFWPEQVEKLKVLSDTSLLEAPISAIEAILHYTSGPWQLKRSFGDPILDEDKASLEQAFYKLKTASINMSEHPFNPILTMIVQNYLGLYELRAPLASADPVQAYKHFAAAKVIADKHERQGVNLWRGFIDFNFARCIIQARPHLAANQILPLREVLRTAVGHRETWTKTDVSLPHFLSDILFTEYLSAYKLLAENHENPLYADKFKVEKENWAASPQGRRFARANEYLPKKNS